MAKPKRKSIHRLTKRWILNSFVVIVGIVLAVIVLASFMIQRYYYNQVEQLLVSRADMIRNHFTQMADNPTGGELDQQMQEYVAGFEYRDKMDLMIINEEHIITATSSGFTPESPELPDLTSALGDTSGPGRYVGRLGTNEKVFALCVLDPVPESAMGNSDTMAFRLVTSMSKVDRQLATIIITISVLGIAALSLVLFSSSYFLNSIIRPIGEVGDTARMIAQGNFDVRLVNSTDDEIGELADIINYMADELQTAEELKNDFISSVSHELRTPLTAIQGWAETLRLGEMEPEMMEKGMEIILSETQRLSEMVEELLDFSRMQSGQLKLIRSRTDVLAELSEAVLMYTQRAQREGIQIIYEEPEDVVAVYGDKNRLRQVFINIIDNAIKYSDPGDTVTVDTHITPETVEIIIEDTGIGIQEKDLPQIKDRFYKAGSTRRGSGIGLAVADEIVTRHKGKLTIESVKGQGTTIVVSLPVYHKAEDIAQVDRPPTEPIL